MFVQRHTFRTHHHNLQHSSTVCKSTAIVTHDKRAISSISDHLTPKERRDKRCYESSKVIVSTEKRALTLKDQLKLSRQSQSNIETCNRKIVQNNTTKFHARASSTPSSFRLLARESLTRPVHSFHTRSLQLRRSKSLSSLEKKQRPSIRLSSDCIFLDSSKVKGKSRQLVVELKNNEVPKRSPKCEEGKILFSNSETRKRIEVKRVNSVDKILGNVSQLLESIRKLWYLSYFCLDFVTYQLETWRLLTDGKVINYQENCCHCNSSCLKKSHKSNLEHDRVLRYLNNYNSQSQEAASAELGGGSRDMELYSNSHLMEKNSTMIDYYFPEHYGYCQKSHPLRSMVRSHDEHFSSSINPRPVVHDSTLLRGHLDLVPTPSTSDSRQRQGMYNRFRIKSRTTEGGAMTRHTVRQNKYDPVTTDIFQVRASMNQAKPLDSVQLCRITSDAQQVNATPSIDQHSVSNSFENSVDEPHFMSLPLTNPNSHNVYQARNGLRAGAFTQHSVDGLLDGRYQKNKAHPSYYRPVSSISQHKSRHYDHNCISSCIETFEKNLKVGSDSELYLSNPSTSSKNNKSRAPSFATRLMNHTSLDYSSKVLQHSETASVSATCKGLIRQSVKSQDSNGSSSKKNISNKLSLSGARKRLGFKQNGLNALSVQRSEEVLPFDTTLSFSDSITEDSSLWSSQVQWQSTYDNLSSFFIEGLGPGQIASRQALVSPYLGDIQLTLSDRRGMLEVEVVRARRLHAKLGTMNLPSPYVKVYLMKNKKCIAKWKTSQVRQTLDPLYQQLFIFREEYAHCVVQVIVWGDYGKKDKKSLMGAVQINIDELDISDLVIGWYKLLNAPSMVNSLHSSKALRQMMLAKQV